MPTKYRFFIDNVKEHNLIIVRLIGDMPSTIFVDSLFDLYKKLDKPWTYKRLLDLRKFDGFISYNDLEHLARRWAFITRNEFYSNKVAMVSHSAIETARISTIAPLFPNDILRGFATIDPALDWLNEI